MPRKCDPKKKVVPITVGFPLDVLSELDDFVSALNQDLKAKGLDGITRSKFISLIVSATFREPVRSFVRQMAGMDGGLQLDLSDLLDDEDDG